jgi:hypothetical protein
MRWRFEFATSLTLNSVGRRWWHAILLLMMPLGLGLAGGVRSTGHVHCVAILTVLI